MNKNWNGIMKVLEVQHIRNNKVIWEDVNLYNMLHGEGQKLILEAVFAGGSIPSSYYMGLDNRGTLAVEDTLESLLAEPSLNGYSRDTISSETDFIVAAEESGNYKAQSVLLTFL